jgi:hypothetical protein
VINTKVSSFKSGLQRGALGRRAGQDERTRPPSKGLDGMTPEACGIKLKGENKWISLTQNASMKTKTN